MSRWTIIRRAPYKKKYSRLHRRDNKDMCRHYLDGDEEAFEKMVSERFKGGIDWDIF